MVLAFWVLWAQVPVVVLLQMFQARLEMALVLVVYGILLAIGFSASYAGR